LSKVACYEILTLRNIEDIRKLNFAASMKHFSFIDHILRTPDNRSAEA